MKCTLRKSSSSCPALTDPAATIRPMRSRGRTILLRMGGGRKTAIWRSCCGWRPRLVSCGRISLAPLTTRQYPLEEAPQSYQTILDPASGSLAVLLRYPAADQKDPIQSFSPRFRVEAAAPVEAAPGELQVALVGAGNLARWHHLPNLKKIPKVHLRAVHSASGARGKSYARRFGAAYCCSDYEEILKDAAVD